MDVRQQADRADGEPVVGDAETLDVLAERVDPGQQREHAERRDRERGQEGEAHFAGGVAVGRAAGVPVDRDFGGQLRCGEGATDAGQRRDQEGDAVSMDRSHGSPPRLSHRPETA